MPQKVYIAVSIDGYIATEDGDIQWLNDIPPPENTDYGYTSFLNSIDAIVMGRKTYDTVASFKDWPYSKKVFILSTQPLQIPDHLTDRAEIVSGEIPQITQTLHDRGYHALYIDGGMTISSFLSYDLIDEIILTTIPVILGSGRPLFSEINRVLKFKHTETRVFSAGVIQTRYTRKK